MSKPLSNDSQIRLCFGGFSSVTLIFHNPVTVPVGMELLVYIRLIMISLVLCLRVILSFISSLKRSTYRLKLPGHFLPFSENRYCRFLLQGSYK